MKHIAILEEENRELRSELRRAKRDLAFTRARVAALERGEREHVLPDGSAVVTRQAEGGVTVRPAELEAQTAPLVDEHEDPEGE